MSVPLLPSKAQRIAALKLLCAGLEGNIAVALADLGDLLRRSDALGLDEKALQRRLSGYRAEDVQRDLERENGADLKAALHDAIEESLQSFFSDDAAEQEEWRISAAQALLRRDRLQSQHRAIELLALSNEALLVTAEGLEKKLAQLDQAVAPHARALVPLNPFRRDERDLLNAAERAAAWWFSSRAECDPFLEALAGNTDNPHTPKCRECLADLERSRIATKPPSIHLTAELAFDLDLGAMPESVEKRYRKHAETCPPCKEILKAIEAGDRAIDELESAESSTTQQKAARRRDEETLEEAKDYRVILRRREGRWRLLVAPRAGVTVASAQLTLSNKRNALAPHAVAQGLEFDLGEELPEGATAQLRLKLGSSAASLDRTYSL